jgi:hypothetical protein
MNIDHVPQWAYSWCYIFAALGFIALLKPLMAVFMMRELGVTLALLVASAGLIAAATNFTLFWMCRSSLRGMRNLNV